MGQILNRNTLTRPITCKDNLQAPMKIMHQRLRSLDVFRGITVIIMILVNSPGNQNTYRWLAHSQWHGCTLADLVFPFFLFIVGLSLSFPLRNQLNKGVSIKTILCNVINRSLLLFIIGVALNAFPSHFNVHTLRFYGVLQRIAICYFITACLFLTTSVKTQCYIFLSLLILYWYALTQIAIPEFGMNNLTPLGNAAAFLDRALLSSTHLYGKYYDPEGLLSTIPAIASALLGCLTGQFIQSNTSQKKIVLHSTLMGILLLILGKLWSISFPINKSLWTSSYVLWCGGWALLMFSFLFWLIEIKHWKPMTVIFERIGRHAMLLYILHIVFLKLQIITMIHGKNGSTKHLKLYLSEQLFGWVPMPLASLLYALSYVLIWILVIQLYVVIKSKRTPRWTELKSQ